MNNQKLEDILNLALETPEEVRARTGNLNIGFNTENRTWELIVKYHGSLDQLLVLNVQVEYLIAGYAILTVPETLVDSVVELEQIEYVEKPKRYFYAVANAKADSCVTTVTLREPYLSGEGVLIAVLDSGIDYRRQDFRNDDGSSRILYLWDQTVAPTAESGITSNGVERRPPEGFLVGTEFTQEQINRAIEAPTRAQGHEIVPSIDVSGHGTAVTGIAAGSGGELENIYEGVAPNSDLLIVKLGIPEEFGFPRTTEIMRGITYAVRKGIELQMPLVINLSFGNTYGAHDGSSLLERFLDNAAEIGRTVICVGSGNEGNSSGHITGNVQEDTVVELAVAEYEYNLSIQLWKQYSDQYRIRLRSPGGVIQELPQSIEGGKFTVRMEQTDILTYIGEPTPYSVDQEIYLELIPVDRPYINSGVWQIIIEPVEIVTGQYYLYLSGSAVRNDNTGFYNPTPQVTLTIPSTASKVITVGAYDSTYNSYADFSGRGYVDQRRTVGVVTAGLTKPDIVAPGVDIVAPDLYGGYRAVTGTSFATPLVTGSAALLMEWGIVKNNDPFLYGEKVKSYLRKGAKVLRGEQNIPNDRVGYGALCVEASLPL